VRLGLRQGAIVALFTLLVGTSSGIAQQPLQCGAARWPMVVAELLFGRKIGGHLGVTEAKWARFVDREITPRFPDGLTVIDVKGQWRDLQRNVIVREPSKMVMIILQGRPDDDERLKAVIEAYKKEFTQQSVGLIVRPACVAF
jgi:hypothetical protein